MRSERPEMSSESTDLRSFLAECEREGDGEGSGKGGGMGEGVGEGVGVGWVEHVPDPVSPRYEVARRLYDAPDRTLVFDQVSGHATRLVGGVAARRSALARTFGVEEAALVPHVAQAMVSRSPGTSKVSEGVFAEEEVASPDLRTEIPPVVFYPQGERAYLSAGIIAARSAQHGMNYSFHRMMFLEGNRLVVRVVPRHLHMILGEGGGQAQVAVLLGVHPAISVAAACSGPPDLDELELAGRILGRSIPATDLAGLRVPAETEIVLLGRFTGETAMEGPFVDITGTLDGERLQPVLRVERLYRRKRPLCPVILPGGAEHRLLMGLPQEPRIWNGVRAAVPSLRDVALTDGGTGWLHAVLVVDSRVEGQARNAGVAALAAHPSLKRVVVVDPDVDPRDPVAVEWAMATRCQPDRDVIVLPHARGSSLDPSRDPRRGTTAKWIIDATRPVDGKPEEFERVAPPRAGVARVLQEQEATVA